MSTAKRGKVLLTAFVAVLASGLGAGRAEAQWGLGGGGIGFFGGFGGYVEQPNQFLNQVAIAQMAHVKGPPGSNRSTSGLNPYAGSSNAYFNHVRDNGFVDQYSVSARQPAYYRAPSPARGRGATPVAMTVAQSRPFVPIANFFNVQGQLVWPGDAPTADSLKEKRATFDQSARVVLDEIKKNGVASIAAVTEARQKLLDYGRPPMKYVRTHETAGIADYFHGFMLELYDSLAQAANSPFATAAAGTPRSPSS
jgi:hypothetical protein